MFARATLISGLLLAATAILWIAALSFDPYDKPISFGESFHVGITGRGLDGRIAFFSDPIGPYRGSITGLAPLNLDRDIAFGDAFGLYYRYFRWPNGDVLWTLLISFWYPAALFGILPTAWTVRLASFSLRTLLIATTLVAVVLGILALSLS